MAPPPRLGSKPFALSTVGCCKKASSTKTRLVKLVPGISPFLGFFLRPEGQWSGLSSKGSYRVRLHHQKPRNRRVTHAVGGCKAGKAGKAGKACHAFHRAVVHRVPNNPLFVLLPDFVSHRNPGESSQISQSAIRNHPRQIALLWRMTPSSSVRTAYPHFSSVISVSNKS